MAVQVTFGAPDPGIVPIYVDGKRLQSSIWQNDGCGWYTSDEASLGDATGGEWSSLEDAMQEIDKALQTHDVVELAPEMDES